MRNVSFGFAKRELAGWLVVVFGNFGVCCQSSRNGIMVHAICRKVEDRLVAVLTSFDIVAVASAPIGAPVPAKALGLLTPQAPLNAQPTVSGSGYGAPPAQPVDLGKRAKTEPSMQSVSGAHGQPQLQASGGYGQPVQQGARWGQPYGGQHGGLPQAGGHGNAPGHAGPYGAVHTPYGTPSNIPSAGLAVRYLLFWNT
jgi:hypothetical protein